MSDTVLTVFSAVLGAIIGSFLNACIHRMPRNISLDNPRRSFCPSCNRSLPWYENLPLISWLVLRGKCSGCGAKISIRYFLVELLTAALFLAVWLLYGLPLAPVYALFMALLVVATFIDIEHFIIPDEITIGGTVAGAVLSFALPSMMQTSNRFESLGYSVFAAAVGFGLLWLIVEFGKRAFGKKRHKFPKPEPFSIREEKEDENERIFLAVGEEKLAWEDVFSRESDRLILEVERATVAGLTVKKETEGSKLSFSQNRIFLDGEEIPIGQIDSVSGTLKAISIARGATELENAGKNLFLAGDENEIDLPQGEASPPKTDTLVLDIKKAVVTEKQPDREFAGGKLSFSHNKLKLEGEEVSIEQIDSVSGTLKAITIPREAMGFGDVKFIAAIGAFLGWKAILFTVCAASVIGCVAALAGLFIAKDKAGSRVPFGPFLALGAAIWIFGGDRLWDWYFSMFGNGDSVIRF